MEVIHPQCAGLDVHKQTVVACVRVTMAGRAQHEVRTFATTAAGLLALQEWLGAAGCAHAGGRAARRLPFHAPAAGGDPEAGPARGHHRSPGLNPTGFHTEIEQGQAGTWSATSLTPRSIASNRSRLW